VELTKLAIISDQSTGPAELYEAICLDAAKNVEANFVSIWRFDTALSKIVCLFAIDIETKETSSGQELCRDDFPKYFETILEETTICAPNACTHPVTKELAEVYFKPNRIESLLDFIVHKNFKPVGVICCESKNIRRDWSAADVAYLRKLATYTSFRATV